MAFGAELATSGCGVLASGLAAVGRLPSIATQSDASGLWGRWAVQDNP